MGRAFIFALDAILILACGEKKGGYIPEDGLIFVENDTDWGVLYTLEDLDAGIIIAEGNVPAGQRVQLVQEPIKGGTRVRLTLVARHGTTNSAKLEFVVDGNVTYRVPSIGAWGSGHLPVERVG